jgi:mono/diheme cytochrome c family protein
MNHKSSIATLAAGALLASLGAAGIAGTAGAQDTADTATSGNAARGKALYYAHGCYGCHGYNGQTGARDLVGTNSPLVADADTFVTFLRLRSEYAPVLPSTRMPNFPEDALSDAEARDIYAYVRSFELDAPAVEDIPTFQKILKSAERPYAQSD